MSNPILGTEVITQVGLLVHDIEKTRRKFAEFFGVELPDIIITDTMDIAQTKYMGQPSPARSKLCFFHAGPNVDIELIQPDHSPSTWRHDLDQNGEGFHHIAFVIKGMKDKIMTLESAGMKLLQTGEYTGGRYAYLDANDSLKMVLELLEND